jgi:hypothetical protein
VQKIAFLAKSPSPSRLSAHIVLKRAGLAENDRKARFYT